MPPMDALVYGYQEYTDTHCVSSEAYPAEFPSGEVDLECPLQASDEQVLDFLDSGSAELQHWKNSLTG